MQAPPVGGWIHPGLAWEVEDCHVLELILRLAVDQGAGLLEASKKVQETHAEFGPARPPLTSWSRSKVLGVTDCI